MKNKSTRYRGKRGSIAFGAVLALILVMLGVGFMAMVLYMGGQHETKNAVDAGALNIGKQIMDNTFSSLGLGLLDEKQRIYNDVLSSDPYKLVPDFKAKATMRNINRVWAKALLIGINAEAADKDGNAGSAMTNAQSAIEGAESLSNDLQKKVIDPTNWRAWFDDVAKQNSVRMLGKDASMQALNAGKWQTSLMMRDAESNIELVGDAPGFNLPPNYQLSDDAYTDSTRTSKDSTAAGRHFLKGYTPITVAGKTIWQIPFPYDEKTHLVSGPEFVANTQKAKPLSWDKPIPNAFSAEGASVKAAGGLGEHATSYVITNPHESFRLSIPHSFLKIHIEKPKTHWEFFPPNFKWTEFGDEQEYDFQAEQSQDGPTMPLGGVGCSTSSAGTVEHIGSDVVGRPIDWLLFPPEFNLINDNDFSPLEKIMVNRINEMITVAGTAKEPTKALTADDLHDCLLNWLTVAYLKKGIQDYYIFSPDGKKITCQPEEIAEVMAPWLRTDMNMIKNDPEGTEKKIIDDAWTWAAITGEPSSVPLQIPIPFTNFFDGTTGTWDENVYWTPGSGYNGCLGTIRLERYTDVHTLSICVPL